VVRFDHMVAISLTALSLSCRAEAPSLTPRAVPAASRVESPIKRSKRPAVYVVSAESLRRHRALAASRDALPPGAIINGLRVSYPGGEVAEDVAEPQLVGGASVPPHLGGGFLFWSSAALYRSPTLLGQLVPVRATGTTISRVGFGPRLALLHGSDDSRHALELPSGRPIPMPLPGLSEIASAGPGAHLALAYPGRVLLASADGKFEPLPQRFAIDALFPGDDEVWLQDANGQFFRLGRDGSFAAFDRMPARPRPTTLRSDPRWPLLNETPLERAVRRGVPIGSGQALVDAEGAMAKVDLASGELVELGRRFLPGSGCRLLAVDDGILATCASQRGGAFVASGLDGGSPRIEKTFGSSGVFFFAGGASLIFSGPCGPSARERDSICARLRDGSWKSLALSSDRYAGAPAHSVRRWIPTPDGGALGVVATPTPGLLELPSGSLTPFADKGYESVPRLMQPAAVEQLVDDVTLDDAGNLRILVDDGSLELRRDGSVERSPHRIASIARSGRFALGKDGSGSLWQTTDWGESWQAAAPPPLVESRALPAPRHCSMVGCDLASWYRIGYPEEQEAPPPSWKKAPPAPIHSAEDVHELVCSPAGVARLTGPGLHPQHAAETLDLGARLLAPHGSRAVFSMADDGPRVVLNRLDGAAGLRILSIKMIEPFSLRPIVRSGRPPGGLIAPNRLEGGDAPLPVTSGGAGAGWLLPSDDDSGALALWIRADRPARAIAFGQRAPLPGSVAFARGEELVVLTSSGDSCAERALSVGARGAMTVFELPARPASASCAVADQLATADDGTLAALRFPSGKRPPSSDDPALLFRAGNQLSLLAAWSELRAGDSAECRTPASDDVRAVIYLDDGWIGTRLGNAATEPNAHTMLALVRWSPSRVCLEAVELAGGLDLEAGNAGLQTALVARFGPTLEASRRGIGFGLEYSEPLTCRLERR
jgi:hypothetical protein